MVFCQGKMILSTFLSPHIHRCVGVSFFCYNTKSLRPCSLMDKAAVFGTADRGSIPFRGAKSNLAVAFDATHAGT